MASWNSGHASLVSWCVLCAHNDSSSPFWFPDTGPKPLRVSTVFQSSLIFLKIDSVNGPKRSVYVFILLYHGHFAKSVQTSRRVATTIEAKVVTIHRAENPPDRHLRHEISWCIDLPHNQMLIRLRLFIILNAFTELSEILYCPDISAVIWTPDTGQQKWIDAR